MTRMGSEFSLKMVMNIEYFLGFSIKLETSIVTTLIELDLF